MGDWQCQVQCIVQAVWICRTKPADQRWKNLGQHLICWWLCQCNSQQLMQLTQEGSHIFIASKFPGNPVVRQSQDSNVGTRLPRTPFEPRWVKTFTISLASKRRSSWGGFFIWYVIILMSNSFFISSNREYLACLNKPIPSTTPSLHTTKSPCVGFHHMSERGSSGSIGKLGMAPR